MRYMKTSFSECYSVIHNQPCYLLQTETLWGQTFCRVWLPVEGVVVRVRAEELVPLEEHASSLGAHHLVCVAAAARIEEALAQGVLLAPLSASVIPLPHQIHALSRAVSGDRIRYLLADEVGLGKTIEAGLIMQELKLRGLVRRTLVVAPKGLVRQWVSEMCLHFNEDFQLVLPEGLAALRRLAGGNPWMYVDQAVVPMDSVKPLEKRRSWGAAQVAAYNRERFEDLISAGWDLIIVDEAHRLGGSTDEVARFKLGQGLAAAAPYLLLLSATPHQGKTDSFHRLLTLLDPEAFPDRESVTRERVRKYVIRTEKRQAVDLEGKPLFKPRQTRLLPISWGERHREQRLLYEAVTEYVRQGYNQALKEKKNYLGFLMILMQRLVTSSTRAIRTALERRLEALSAPPEGFPLFPVASVEEWAELDGEEQMDLLLASRLQALKNERAEVKTLLEAARRTEAAGPDAKAEALLELIYRLQQEEADPELKILIFTEFVPTQEMLRDFLQERGFSVVCLNGSMDLEERQKVQEAFAREAQILISTDAGGEGVNLQFCHVVVNYDIPWNPMRLEQRIGRVDRIGQKKTVRAINFVLESTVEHRVQEVLQEKLAVILQEFGVDKTADVLDSAEAEKIFDKLYLDALMEPEKLEDKVSSLLKSLQEQAQVMRESSSLLEGEKAFDPARISQLIDPRIEYWTETMTVAYLKAHGQAKREGRTWSLIWPDGEKQENVVFTAREAEVTPSATYLALKDPRVSRLVAQLSPFFPGQPIPVMRLADLPEEVRGFWSLWKIAVCTADKSWRKQREIPLFLHDDGRTFLPAAQRIWDRLLSGELQEPEEYLRGPEAVEVFNRLREIAEKQGHAVYEELLRAHQDFLNHEREKGMYTFSARRQAVMRLGLPAVRSHRLAKLEEEEKEWLRKLGKKADVVPEMVPLLVVRVVGGLD
ncbi:DEAD/DEAH box helicase [Desulfothermobacter acidiphilus]|uniref:DEAD/DEAH box helicase n=1 Tax=Desulfothermobacter acidiphilus TaxID=1938353 RepID=UPI003F8A9101